MDSNVLVEHLSGQNDNLIFINFLYIDKTPLLSVDKFFEKWSYNSEKKA